MALYEVTLYQDYYGVQCLNRWNYIMTGTPAVVSGSFALTSAMGFITEPAASIFEVIRDLQSASVRYVSTTVREVWDEIDFYERPFVANLVGRNGTEGMPPFVSYGFRTSRSRQDIRRATKRFVGVTEGDVVGGGAIITAALTRMQDLATKMSAALTYTDEGNNLTFSPCVVSKESYAPEPGKRAYRYYADEATQMQHVATGIVWEAYPHARSQTSRQFGRGV